MAPEIANVNTGETIASEYGNALRDRTVQRYANAAERATEHPSPTVGDLAFLADSGTVEVFRSGTGWTNVDVGSEVNGHNQVDGSLSLTTSFANAASVSLSIPSDWASWECEAWARALMKGVTSTGNEWAIRVVIDGTAGQVVSEIDAFNRHHVSIGSRRTGITTTGSRTVAFQVRRVGGSGGDASLRYLYARAVRTS